MVGGLCVVGDVVGEWWVVMVGGGWWRVVVFFFGYGICGGW